jgi:hypothetical protein
MRALKALSLRQGGSASQGVAGHLTPSQGGSATIWVTPLLDKEGVGGIGARISLPMIRRLPSREAGHRE